MEIEYRLYKRMADKTEQLIDACSYGHKNEKEALRLLRSMKDDEISKRNERGKTALYFACANKMKKVAFELVSRTTDFGPYNSIFNVHNKSAYSLYWQCMSGSPDQHAIFDKKKYKEEDKSHQLIEACYFGNEKEALRLLRTMKDDEISKRNERGETALYWACKNEMKKVALGLIPRTTDFGPYNEKFTVHNKSVNVLYWQCMNGRNFVINDKKDKEIGTININLLEINEKN